MGLTLSNTEPWLLEVEVEVENALCEDAFKA
jgi:hypothetical protein